MKAGLGGHNQYTVSLEDHASEPLHSAMARSSRPCFEFSLDIHHVPDSCISYRQLPLSGPSSPILSHRVQNRRGSTSTADPSGNHLHLNLNPGRTMSCKLTIVRVNPTPPIQLDEQPPSPQQPLPEFAQAAPRKPRPRPPRREEWREHVHELRLGLLCSARIILGIRDATGRSHPRSASPYLYAEATPFGDQLVLLAHQSCNPQSTPVGVHLRQRPERPAPRSPPILDDVFLPFVDRAEEVKALFTSPQPGARLFALLAQIFPPQSAPEPPVTDESVFATDPRQWSSRVLGKASGS